MWDWLVSLWERLLAWLKSHDTTPPPATGDPATEDDPDTEEIPPEPEPGF